MIVFKKYSWLTTIDVHKYDSNRMYSKDFMDNIRISDKDRKNGSPKLGDVIIRNPKNYNDLWLMSKEDFEREINMQLIQLNSIQK